MYNLKGDVVGKVDLPDGIFGCAWKSDLVHQALQTQLANRRLPWAHAKTRAEVRGGGKKPWRQKGTGRARHGSIRSPLWVGGGVAHGPLKFRNYEKKINKKMLRTAIHSSLAKKLADQELKVVDSLALSSAKTKEAAKSLKTFFKNSMGSVLLVPTKDNKIIHRAIRNIPKVKGLVADSLNVREILEYKNILIDKEAIKDIK
ncbi:MAG: 50S ribosomal protein L4 [bacterium]|nr:50S ribosomal protein L4 [bacterium]